MHIGGAEKAKNYNLGTLLKEPIEKFNEEIKIKENNNKAQICKNDYIKEIK